VTHRRKNEDWPNDLNADALVLCEEYSMIYNKTLSSSETKPYDAENDARRWRLAVLLFRLTVIVGFGILGVVYFAIVFSGIKAGGGG